MIIQEIKLQIRDLVKDYRDEDEKGVTAYSGKSII